MEESFESTPYNNYYGACITSEGCFETSMETCRAIGGRFQGPGTSCGGAQPPIMMRSETTETKGKGNSLWLAVTVGVMTGVATTIFGNILSEMWLDRLREDPELHTTPDDIDDSEIAEELEELKEEATVEEVDEKVVGDDSENVAEKIDAEIENELAALDEVEEDK